MDRTVREFMSFESADAADLEEWLALTGDERFRIGEGLRQEAFGDVEPGFFISLNSHGVEYLLIGGCAYNYHAPPRATKDVDVWVRPTQANLERLRESIRAFGFPADRLDSARLAAETTVLMLGRVPQRIDVLTRPTGLVWEEAWLRRRHPV